MRYNKWLYLPRAWIFHLSTGHSEYIMLQDEWKFWLFPMLIIEFTNTYGHVWLVAIIRMFHPSKTRFDSDCFSQTYWYISMGKTILYFKGLLVKISELWYLFINYVPIQVYCFILNSKQCRPWRNVTLCSISSGSFLFAKVPGYRYLEWKGLKKRQQVNRAYIPQIMLLDGF